MPVEAESAAQFRHGPLELADGRLTTVIFRGPDPKERALNFALERDLVRYGARVFTVDDDPGCGALAIPAADADARPILESLPLQLLTIALAEGSGVEPGVFRHLAKVTTGL